MSAGQDTRTAPAGPRLCALERARPVLGGDHARLRRPLRAPGCPAAAGPVGRLAGRAVGHAPLPRPAQRGDHPGGHLHALAHGGAVHAGDLRRLLRLHWLPHPEHQADRRAVGRPDPADRADAFLAAVANVDLVATRPADRQRDRAGHRLEPGRRRPDAGLAAGPGPGGQGPRLLLRRALVSLRDVVDCGGHARDGRAGHGGGGAGPGRDVLPPRIPVGLRLERVQPASAARAS